MKNHGIVAAIVVFALIIVGMFVFAYIKKSELTDVAQPQNTPVNTTDTPYSGITRVEGRHYYIDGTHTVVGEILMPTPCDLLNWDVSVAESMPEQATVAFNVVNTTETCAQVITPQLFSASFEGSEEARISATLNGRPVELNLTPAQPGERPEDYEFSGKG